MMDIVERLNDSLNPGYSEMRKEAAAEITRLREEVGRLRVKSTARKALANTYYSMSQHADAEISRLKEQNATLLAVLRRAGDAIEALDGTSVTNERLVDDYRAALAICPSGRAVPVGAIGTILTEVMNIASKNGADSRSMPDEYVEVAAWLCGVTNGRTERAVADCGEAKP